MNITNCTLIAFLTQPPHERTLAGQGSRVYRNFRGSGAYPNNQGSRVTPNDWGSAVHCGITV